jgi:hypothetical protein
MKFKFTETRFFLKGKKIKVGDKLLVTRKPTQAELKDWDDTWTESMDDFVGKVIVVGYLHIVTSESKISSVFDGVWNYPLCVLERVDRTPREKSSSPAIVKEFEEV